MTNQSPGTGKYGLTWIDLFFLFFLTGFVLRLATIAVGSVAGERTAGGCLSAVRGGME